jgi:hypothetical protein
MPGTGDLGELIASLSPVRRDGRFVFVTTDRLPADIEPSAMVDEDEGRSYVIPIEDAERHALPFDFVGAWITLAVSSSLSAVGLTAVVSTTLSGAGISCNVIAGHHHDHLLVPVDRADDALAVLEELAAGS